MDKKLICIGGGELKSKETLKIDGYIADLAKKQAKADLIGRLKRAAAAGDDAVRSAQSAPVAGCAPVDYLLYHSRLTRLRTIMTNRRKKMQDYTVSSSRHMTETS